MGTKKPDFEKSLTSLETLIERMEQGDQPLERALKDFEQGIRLVRECQQVLSAAEQKVRILTEADENQHQSDEAHGDTQGIAPA